jgi:hypothetical protein
MVDVQNPQVDLSIANPGRKFIPGYVPECNENLVLWYEVAFNTFMNVHIWVQNYIRGYMFPSISFLLVVVPDALKQQKQSDDGSVIILQSPDYAFDAVPAMLRPANPDVHGCKKTILCESRMVKRDPGAIGLPKKKKNKKLRLNFGCLPCRVTRLGEFSPNGRLLTLGRYFENC